MHNSIHRHTVHTQLNKDSKQTLTRISRNRLARLRTGYCPLLNSYLSGICDNIDYRCIKCDVAPRDVNHFLNCNKNTKDLKVIDLWERTVEVAKWLDVIPSVLHDHTAQNNPPSLPFSPDVDDAPPGPPNPEAACHSPWRK